MGSITLPDNGQVPDLNSIVSNVLNSMGLNTQGATQGPRTTQSQTAMPQQRPSGATQPQTTTPQQQNVSAATPPVPLSQVATMLERLRDFYTHSNTSITRLIELFRIDPQQLSVAERNEAQNLSSFISQVYPKWQM